MSQRQKRSENESCDGSAADKGARGTEWAESWKESGERWMNDCAPDWENSWVKPGLSERGMQWQSKNRSRLSKRMANMIDKNPLPSPASQTVPYHFLYTQIISQKQLRMISKQSLGPFLSNTEHRHMLAKVKHTLSLLGRWRLKVVGSLFNWWDIIENPAFIQYFPSDDRNSRYSADIPDVTWVWRLHY